MQSGRLRHRIEIQQSADAPDEYGQGVAVWSTVSTRWGEVVPLEGRELWQAQQVQADVTHRVRLRYDTPPAPKSRLAHRGRVLNILSVMVVEERRKELVIYCREEV